MNFPSRGEALSPMRDRDSFKNVHTVRYMFQNPGAAIESSNNAQPVVFSARTFLLTHCQSEGLTVFRGYY